jgi:hypothetical protein
MQESTSGELKIDAPAEHVQWFLDYVHGTLRSIDGHMAAPLFQLAELYGVVGLLRACEARLIRDLSIQNIPAVLELSDMHGNEALLRSCVAVVQASRCVLLVAVLSIALVNVVRFVTYLRCSGLGVCRYFVTLLLVFFGQNVPVPLLWPESWRILSFGQNASLLWPECNVFKVRISVLWSALAIMFLFLCFGQKVREF